MASTTGKNSGSKIAGVTPEERAAMKEYAQERRRQASRGSRASRETGEADVLEKIAALQEPERSMAQRIHEIVAQSAPALWPRTWYGMPAYANADGKVVCFLQPGSKFKARYATLGFNDAAQLDDGELWPTSFAITSLTAEVERRIAELVARAAG